MILSILRYIALIALVVVLATLAGYGFPGLGARIARWQELFELGQLFKHEVLKIYWRIFVEANITMFFFMPLVVIPLGLLLKSRGVQLWQFAHVAIMSLITYHLVATGMRPLVGTFLAVVIGLVLGGVIGYATSLLPLTIWLRVFKLFFPGGGTHRRTALKLAFAILVGALVWAGLRFGGLHINFGDKQLDLRLRASGICLSLDGRCADPDPTATPRPQ